MSTIRLLFGHFPLQHTDPKDQRVRTIDAAFDLAERLGVGAIDWTEVEQPDQLTAIDNRKGWTTYWPAGRDSKGRPRYRSKLGKRLPAQAVPISHRDSIYRSLGGDSRQISIGRFAVSPARFANRDHLEHLDSGEDLHYLGSHMVSGVDGAGKTPKAWRRTQWRKGRNVFLERVKAGNPTIGASDTNETDFPELMAHTGVTVHRPEKPTHGARTIDWFVTYDPDARLSPQQFKTVAFGTSDHKAVIATIDLVQDATTPGEPMWRVARSLDILLDEINKAAPKRSKLSDGSIGDAAHASRTSDHNPWVKDSRGVGVVRARDFTHDPADGMDADRLAANVAALLGKHPALGSGAYVIRNRRIISTNRKSEGWRPYTGSNPHDKHVHVSVGTSGYDATAPWNVMSKPEPAKPAAPASKTPRADKLVEQLVAARRTAGEIIRDEHAKATHRVTARSTHWFIKAALRRAERMSEKH